MIGRYFVQQSLKSLLRGMLLLLFCSVAGTAQSPSDAQESRSLVNIAYKDASVKDVIETLGKQLKINVVFDDTVRNIEKIDIEMNDVSLEQAMKIVIVQKGLQARIIEENTIIVFVNNESNRKRYEEYKPWPAGSAQSPSNAQGSGWMKIVYKDSLVKSVFNTLGKLLNINIVFDDTVRDSLWLDIELNDVTLEQAMKIIFIQKGLQARIIEENTIIVFVNSESNRRRFKEYKIWPAKSDGNK